MAQAHGVATAVPLIELADHRHALGIRGPHRKAHAADAVDAHRLRAQAACQRPVCALVEQMQVQIAQQQPEGVWVFGFLHGFMAGARRPDDAQAIKLRVAIHVLRIGTKGAVEQPRAADRRHLRDDLAARVDGLHAARARVESAHNPARAVLGVQAMGAQHGKRIAQAAMRQRIHAHLVDARRQHDRRLGFGGGFGWGGKVERGHGGPPVESSAAGGGGSACSRRRATRVKPSSGIGSQVGRLDAS